MGVPVDGNAAPPRVPAPAGFSLAELMIAIAILGIIGVIAMPLYRGYLESAATGALINDVATMEVFQEDVMLRTGTYAEGTYDARAGDISLTDATGWRPPGGYGCGVRRRGGHGVELPGHRDRRPEPKRLPDHARQDTLLRLVLLRGSLSMSTVQTSGHKRAAMRARMRNLTPNDPIVAGWRRHGER